MNEKSDIYSFGVVILELVTGRLPIDPEFGDVSFIKWVSTTLNQKGIDHVIDPILDSRYKEVISKILDIGLHCTSLLPKNRPAMREVVRSLQRANADKKSNRVYRDGTGFPYYQEEASDEAVLISRTPHTF